MNATQRRQGFRTVLAGDKCIRPASVYDPLSARIGEDLGFEVGFMTGPSAQMAILGAPNHRVVVLNNTELAQHCYRMCRATDNIAIHVGAHHGYGNALNVMRTVEDLENAGVAGMTIDDMEEPMPFGSGAPTWLGYRLDYKTARMYSLEESVGRMKAAVAARKDPTLVIAARTSALNVADVPEAVRRINAYQEAGVDAIHIDLGGKPRYGDDQIKWCCEALQAISAQTQLPFLMGDESSRMGDLQYLGGNRVRLGHVGYTALAAAVKGIYEVMEALREGKLAADDTDPRMASREMLGQVARQSRYNDWIKEFLT